MLVQAEYLYIFSDMNKRLSKEKQALVLSALCEGMPIEACARMFKVGTNTITRIIRETGEAFADYMDKELRDLPCLRIEMDEQWQYVGCHAGRMLAPDKERGDFWLWAAIDADTKLVFSHRVGKRDWITGHMFVRRRARARQRAGPDRDRQLARIPVPHPATFRIRGIFLRNRNKDIRRADAA